MAEGRAAKTVNGRVATVLTLWRWAYARGLTRRRPEPPNGAKAPKRLPRAWSPEQMLALLAACDAAPPRRTWTAAHWRALVLTIYDTGLRIGALTTVPRSCLDESGRLWVPPELQKGRAETGHKLHPETLAAIAATPRTPLLFRWPLHANELWRRYREDVLEPAGLPSGRRDLFHKIRRTSYTRVYASLGLAAATRHAAHTSDLSAAYLDTTQVRGVEAVDVLPRPQAADPASPAGPLSAASLAALLSRLGPAERDGLAALLSKLVC